MFDAIADFLTMQVLGPLITLVVTAIVGWLAALYTRVTGANLEATHREALQSALTNGIRYAIQMVLEGKLNKDGTVPLSKRSAVLLEAKRYVMDSVPDALAHFKVSEGKLDELLTPKLPNTNDPVPTSLVS